MFLTSLITFCPSDFFHFGNAHFINPTKTSFHVLNASLKTCKNTFLPILFIILEFLANSPILPFQKRKEKLKWVTLKHCYLIYVFFKTQLFSAIIDEVFHVVQSSKKYLKNAHFLHSNEGIKPIYTCKWNRFTYFVKVLIIFLCVNNQLPSANEWMMRFYFPTIFRKLGWIPSSRSFISNNITLSRLLKMSFVDY